MSKRDKIVIGLLTFAFVCLWALDPALYWYSNYIDNLHWIGNAIPPCFVNAKLCAGHVLGSDEVGRDMVARLIVGAGVSSAASLLVVALAGGLGLAFGELARLGGAYVRYPIMRVSEALACFPPWPFVLFAGMIAPRDAFAGGVFLAVVTAVLYSTRVTRFVANSASLHGRPLIGMLLGDWVSVLLTFATVDYFGYGFQPPTATLGNMLANMQAALQAAWWAAVFPAVGIFVLVLAIELARRTVSPAPTGPLAASAQEATTN